MDEAVIQAARDQLRARMGGINTRKGQSRAAILPKVVPNQGQSDVAEKAKSALKRIGMHSLSQISDVSFRKEDGTVMHFSSPKVSIAPHSNTTQVTGTYTIENEDPSSMNNMMELLSKLQHMAPTGAGDKKVAAEDDDEVPSLVEDFDAVATQSEKVTADNLD